MFCLRLFVLKDFVLCLKISKTLFKHRLCPFTVDFKSMILLLLGYELGAQLLHLLLQVILVS